MNMKQLFMLLMYLVQCRALCELKINNITKCSSVHDLKEVSPQPDWTKLEFSISDGSNFATLLPLSFINVPNVEDMKFVRTVNNIKYNAFRKLHDLKTLFFFECELIVVKPGMFTYLPVVSIAIISSRVRIIQPGSFYNIPNLKAVLIYKNSIPKIAAATFSYTNIEILVLNNNDIQTIDEEAFYAMDNLKILGLEGNRLTSFEPELLIGPDSPELRILWLERNQITEITSNSYTNYPKLQVLSFQINSIRNIEKGSFNDLLNLRYLDLSNNQLEYLPLNVLPAEGLPELLILFLQNNRLTYLPNDFVDKLPILRNITIGGNPWQCLCYANLRKQLVRKNVDICCDEDYIHGIRPVCVFPEKISSVCQLQENESENLFDIFSEAIQGYVKLPRVCNLNCDNNKSCYTEHSNFDFNFWVGMDVVDNSLLR